MSDPNRRAFWSSIPGLLTGTAGVVTAIVGLTTVLIQLDVLGDKGSDKATTTTTVASSTVSTQPGATTVPGPGTAGTAPRFSVAPTSATFDMLLKREADVTLRNDGSVPFTVATKLVGRDPGQFGVDARDCTSAAVSGGGECRMKVTYAPSAAGDHVARLQVTAVGGAAPAEVALTGKRL